MSELTTLINTVGFPIVAYFLVVKDNKEIIKNLTIAIKDLSTSMENFNLRLTIIEKEILKNE